VAGVVCLQKWWDIVGLASRIGGLNSKHGDFDRT
jgi:hypothetical protein